MHGDASVNAAGISGHSGYNLATGGIKVYSTLNLDIVLKQVKDWITVFVLSDKLTELQITFRFEVRKILDT